MLLKQNYSLKDYNTFGIDTNAKRFTEILSEEEILSILKERNDNKPFVLGGGSNILFSGKTIGNVLKMSIGGINILEENSSSVLLKAGAGVVWDDLVKYCVSMNFSGIENLSLIPGTVGAAPIQNIGAYGQELNRVFHSLEGYFISDGTKKIFNKTECRFGYRNSIFKNEMKNEFLITSVTLKLNKKFEPVISYNPVKEGLRNDGIENPSIGDMRNLIIKIRQEKLPDPQRLGNAGSFFKNPEVSSEFYKDIQREFPDIKGVETDGKIKLYAGWLIEKCGWKGVRDGNVGCYPKQALVIVNYGGATGEEILLFTSRIKQSVYKNFKLMLEEEVNII